MWASQVGKTETINNLVGYFIACEPSPILYVQPTVDAVEGWSKERFVPMVRDTPCLSGLIDDPKSRTSGNTILMKSFPGGNIAMVGTNSPTGLAGRPRRCVFLDEVDRYASSAGDEGDPCRLAIRRTDGFWNAVVYMTSTPTVKAASKIEREFEQSDKRFYFVPCKECGKDQSLAWAQVKWPKDKPEEAFYECQHCGCHWTDKDRQEAIQRGQWKPTAPFNGIRGYHLNGIYSPFRHKKGFRNRLHQMAVDFLEAKAGGREELKSWTNTFLAETWNEEGEEIEYEGLMKRREPYLPTLPDGVHVITVGADVQGNRIAYVIKGWGDGEESWQLQYREIPGNTQRPEVFAEFDRVLTESKWKKADGTEYRITACCIDSKHRTEEVYAFCKPRFHRRVYAVQGGNIRGAPIAKANPSRGNRKRCPVYMLGTDTAKRLIFGRLNTADFGKGYIHFPADEQYGFDKTYFQMLTAERLTKRRHKGFIITEFEKTRPRNEALDCEVYATAALVILQPNWTILIKKVEKPNEQPMSAGDSKENPQAEKPSVDVITKQIMRRPAGPKRTGWVNSWRRF